MCEQHAALAPQPCLTRPICAGWDVRKFARRAGFAAFGVFNGTELNPEFHQTIRDTVDDKGVRVCVWHLAAHHRD